MDSYLVISPLECTWQKDAHLIFPGDWSYKYTQKDMMASLDCEIDEMEEISWEENYDVWEKGNLTYVQDAVRVIGSALNEYHRIDEDYAYWDLVIGEKIREKISRSYVLYWRIKSALKRHLEIKIKVLSDAMLFKADDNRYQIKVRNAVEKVEFERFVAASKILKSIQTYYDYELVEMDDGFEFEEVQPAAYVEKNSFKHKLYKLINKTILRNVKVVGPLFGKDLRKIIVRTWGMYNPILPQCIDKYPLTIDKNFDERKKIKLNFKYGTDFFKYLSDWLPYELSTGVIEEYKKCITYAEKQMPKAPIVANLFLENEEYHMVMYGVWKKQGTIFSRAAHSLGDQLWPNVEHFEEGVDFYYIWSLNCGQKYRTMPSYKSEKRRQLKSKANSDIILWCGAGSAETSGIYSDYLKGRGTPCYKMKEFIIALDSELKKKLIYRPRDVMNWGAREYYRDVYSDLKIDNEIDATNTGTVIWETFQEACAVSKLIVVETECTGVLGEALSANRPVVIISTLFDDNVHFYRGGVKETFLKLKQFGFFYTDPLEAATFINNNYNNIEELWNQREIQDWRKSFLDKYMYEVDDVDKWVIKEIDALIKEYGKKGMYDDNV